MNNIPLIGPCYALYTPIGLPYSSWCLESPSELP